MANIEKLKQLRALMAELPEQKVYLDAYWKLGTNPLKDKNDCGTAGCVAGYAIALFCPEIKHLYECVSITPIAREALELTEDELQEIEIALENNEYPESFFGGAAEFDEFAIFEFESEQAEALFRLDTAIELFEKKEQANNV
jgi:hypothetical protein